MNTLLYCLARLLIATLQALPLRLVARLSRACGAVAWWLDARHRRVALTNLSLCFAAEKSPAEIRALAKENFRRLGESYGCAVRTAGMSDSGTIATWWARHIPARRGQRFSLSGNLASMANGLPYAIAAQIAHPDRQVVAFAQFDVRERHDVAVRGPAHALRPHPTAAHATCA